MKIALDKITADPNQPRKIFDAAELQSLADSIEQNGLMQPITVRKADKAGTFWLIAGERRYRAHCLLAKRNKAFAHIEAMLDAGDKVSIRVKQIVENDQRADLTPLERAHSYADLIALGIAPDDAAKRCGIPKAKFDARLSLVRLDPQIATVLAGGGLEEAQATEIARLPDHRDQVTILRMINRGEIGKWKSVRAAVDAILGGVTQADFFGASAPSASPKEIETLNAMESRIAKAADLLSAGWKDGACIIANKVSPDRAGALVSRLAMLRQTVRHMEQELLNSVAQARIVLDRAS